MVLLGFINALLGNLYVKIRDFVTLHVSNYKLNWSLRNAKKNNGTYFTLFNILTPAFTYNILKYFKNHQTKLK